MSNSVRRLGVQRVKALLQHRSKCTINLIEPVTAQSHGVRSLTNMPQLMIHAYTSNIAELSYFESQLLQTKVW